MNISGYHRALICAIGWHQDNYRNPLLSMLLVLPTWYPVNSHFLGNFVEGGNFALCIETGIQALRGDVANAWVDLSA